MRAVNAFGTETSTESIGSNRVGSHFGKASWIACRPAVLKAMSELSTAWNWPVIRMTVRSTTGKPSGPCFNASTTPSSTAGM